MRSTGLRTAAGPRFRTCVHHIMGSNRGADGLAYAVDDATGVLRYMLFAPSDAGQPMDEDGRREPRQCPQDILPADDAADQAR